MTAAYIAVAALASVAAILQFALLNSPSIRDIEIVEASRRIKIGAWLLLSTAMWLSVAGLIDSQPSMNHGGFYTLFIFTVSLLGIAEIFISGSRLYELMHITFAEDDSVLEVTGSSNQNGTQ